MAFAITVAICFTWLISLGLLLLYGFPKITKVNVHVDGTEKSDETTTSNPVGFEDPDAVQDELRKAAVLSDLASAVNAFIDGEDK